MSAIRSYYGVISRGSAMRFRGENRPSTPEIAKALDVGAVVDSGSFVAAAEMLDTSTAAISRHVITSYSIHYTKLYDIRNLY